MIDTIINNILQDRDLNGGSTNWANWMSKLTIVFVSYDHYQTFYEITQ